MADLTVSAPTKAGSIEEEEERKLKTKYPGLDRQGVGSLMLQKRLNRGHKFFDSGDYNMARAKILQQKTHVLPPQTEEAILHDSTGDTMATPDSVPAVRKKSMVMTGPGEPVNPVAMTAASRSPTSPRSSRLSESSVFDTRRLSSDHIGSRSIDSS
ncbi:cAMP-regulated phosphoprotein 19 [Clonorchis sinensis]|uniref:cAMP-regulated phosphoprotein 19 n=2 Tax=Opisthorchiidae TaxID=6196 RepID=A0A8T1MTQ8_CLOSI|nr:cAMP-regulated phosphoprotein 19 [Clonorchis sinensis]